MTQKLTPTNAILLVLPPLLWAGNAVVGRLMNGLVPPITLNLLRWVLALLLLLPLAGHWLKPGSGLWAHWRRLTVLGMLGVGSYNSLQYLALKTSTPMNVTLVASSMPVWMLVVGALFFGQKIHRRQFLGALMSIVGVLVVLCRGQWALLAEVRAVPGDLFMLAAAVTWAFYSWLLSQPKEPAELRQDWAGFLLGQVVFGLGWSTAFASAEWATTDATMSWTWPVLLALVYVAVGPAVLAYRCWGLGVQRVGPAVAAFFYNLSPLFAAIMSALFLGEHPHGYHALAFALIVGGIMVSTRR